MYSLSKFYLTHDNDNLILNSIPPKDLMMYTRFKDSSDTHSGVLESMDICMF